MCVCVCVFLSCYRYFIQAVVLQYSVLFLQLACTKLYYAIQLLPDSFIFLHIFLFLLYLCFVFSKLLGPDSYWALDGDGDDGLWMEVYDEATHYKYYLHSVTGETQWAAEEASAGLTVWEELMDPITGEHYYYSNVGNFHTHSHTKVRC